MRRVTLHEEAAAGTPNWGRSQVYVNTRLQHQIDVTDREIDRFAYHLYDLPAEEIAIVEGTTL